MIGMMKNISRFRKLLSFRTRRSQIIGLEIKLQPDLNASARKWSKLFKQGSVVIGKFVGQVVSAQENLANRISCAEAVRSIGTEQRMGSRWAFTMIIM